MAKRKKHWIRRFRWRAKLRHPALLFLLFASCSISHPGSIAGNSLQVTATAYNSVRSQTSGDPFLAAWGDRLKPGMKVIAVSRDLLRMGLKHNTRVKIDGLPGTWLVKDKMNKRWSRKIDLYMGTDIAAARRWGKREVTIRW